MLGKHDERKSMRGQIEIFKEEHQCLSTLNTQNVGEMIDWLRGRGRILILSHDNPDPDSIAAAVALRHLILVKTGEDAILTYGGVIGRSENRQMVELLEISMVPICQLDLNDFAVICLVDTQPQTGNNSLPEGVKVDIVIDHHMSKNNHCDVLWRDVRENYGASATILYEYLTEQAVMLNTRLATSLFYAIKSETQDLGRQWTKADRDAYLKLLPLSNNHILFEIIHPQVGCEYFAAFRTAIENARIYGELLVFNLYHIDNPDLVSELADFLLRQQGVRYVLGIGWFDGAEILSMRSLNPDAMLSLVIQQMVAGLGTAGGHGMIAGGQIRPMSADKDKQKELEELLTERLFTALNLEKRLGEDLLPCL
jgi:nanoRNase/pAp phosphatase (c-di-AMP/oligoRNAs hydrolase)